MAYSRAVPSLTWADFEQALRAQGMKTYVIATVSISDRYG